MSEFDGKPKVRTADAKFVGEGDRVFNYYDGKWGVIRVGSLASDGWFDLDQDDGSSALLNGERISTYELKR